MLKKDGDTSIKFRDALPAPPESARQAATRILRFLGLIGPAEHCPPRCNTTHQLDGWSCGLWVTRWIERSLREVLGEGRQAPVPIAQATARGNEFIQKLKEASDVPAKAKGKAKGKAKAKGTSKKPVDPLASEPKQHKTYEEAAQAAEDCPKCLRQKDGSKGCRGCMGEWYELQRKKGFAARALKSTIEAL